MDKKYTLYADGVKLAEGLTLNGTNYVSKAEEYEEIVGEPYEA